MKKLFLPLMMLCLITFAGKTQAQAPAVPDECFYISASGWAMWEAAPQTYPSQDDCVYDEVFVSFEEPEAGANPSDNFVTEDENYQISDIFGWYESTSFSPMNPTSTFVEGKEYYFIVQVKFKNDCILNDDYSVYLNGDASLTDVANTYYDEAEKILTITSNNFLISGGDDCVISSVNLTGFVEPALGSTVSYDLSVADDNCQITYMEWTDYNYSLDEGDPFEEDNYYYLYVELMPNTGCTVDADNLTFSFNGNPSLVDVLSSGYDAGYDVIYIFSKDFYISGDKLTPHEKAGVKGGFKNLSNITLADNNIKGKIAARHIKENSKPFARFNNKAWGIKGNRSSYSWGFENGMSDFTTIDADGDGYCWALTSSLGLTAHSGSDAVMSQSYVNYVGPLTPDNYLVSPQITIGEDNCTLKFWAGAQDPEFPAEHFGVAVSTTGFSTPADFTTIQEWTMTAKKGSAAMNRTKKAKVRGQNKATGNWYEYTVDLSAYVGQDIYFAIRHFNCTDNYILRVDDISLSDDDVLVGYNVYLDGALVAESITDLDFLQPTEGFADGSNHTTAIEAVYKSGAILEGAEKAWTFQSGDHFTGAPQKPQVVFDGTTANLTWEMPSAGLQQTDYTVMAEEVTILDANDDMNTWEQSGSNTYGIYYSTTGNDDYLITPQLELTSNSELRFNTYCYSSSYPESFEVRLSTTGTEAADFTNILGNETTSSVSGEWFTYDLSEWAGEQVYIAIRNISVDQFVHYVSDITVTNVMREQNHIGAIVYRDDAIVAKLRDGETSYTDEINDEDYPEYCISIIQNGSKEGGVYYALAEKQCSEVTVVCQPVENVTADVDGTNVTVAWDGDASEYVLRYRPYTAPETAIVTLSADNVWGNGSGYQMLIDADASTFGSIIPTVGPLTSSGDAPAGLYDNFEYKIHENADGSLTTSNIIIDNSYSIDVPEGTYDWCITNPTPGDRIWIASEDNGNIPGRYDDYFFEAGKKYEFYVSYNATLYEDQVNLTITDITKNRAEEEWEVVEGIHENSYTIEGLEEGTQYIVEVQAICEDGGVSEWSDGVIFTTIDGMAEKANNISIYPNPTTGIINIDAKDMNYIVIMNALGNVVYKAHVNGNNAVINLGDFGAGIYTLSITTNDVVTVQRVVVVK